MSVRSTHGFALVEVMLALLVVAPLSLYAIQKLNQGIEDTRSAQQAERIGDFTELAKNYYLANGAALRAAMADGTGAAALCRLGVNPVAPDPKVTGIQSNNVTLHTCAIDSELLKWKGLAPSGFPDVNLQQQKMVAVMRRVYDMTQNPAVATDNVELLTVGASGVTGLSNYAPGSVGRTGSVDDLLRDAKGLGASGGIVPDSDLVLCKWDDANPALREACGSLGGWRVKLSDFVSF